MRRRLALCLVAVMLTTACARQAPRPVPAESTADIYVAVLRKYLSTPSDNSFAAGTFRLAFVFDRANAAAADPSGSHIDDGTPIPLSDQQKLTSALADLLPVTFVATHDEVLIPAQESPSCKVVRDNGILVTLAPPKDEGTRVTVGISGYVACMGATWLTYVVVRDVAGWKVTGTTGSRAIA
jgi:hypothetical protein